MTKLKDIFSDNKQLIWDAIIHAGLAWGALALSYNSYKEYVRNLTHLSLPSELKDAIKSTFPWGALIFAGLYFLYGLGFYKRVHYPSVKQYILLLLLYIVITNLFFISTKTSILIVINLFSLYLFLCVWKSVSPEFAVISINKR